MTGLSADTTVLLVVDFQSRLMPVIQDAGPVVANANRLLQGARILGLPAVVTEQNAEGLGSTMADLAVGAECVMVPKRTFSACHAPGFMAALRDRPNVVVAGCETHVCSACSMPGAEFTPCAMPWAPAGRKARKRRCGAWNGAARKS
jgi:nicotinamidase-related amidase